MGELVALFGVAVSVGTAGVLLGEGGVSESEYSSVREVGLFSTAGGLLGSSFGGISVICK